jgi:hypothetical protein
MIVAIGRPRGYRAATEFTPAMDSGGQIPARKDKT